MRRIAIAAAALLGCASETGILLVIDSNPDLTRPAEIVVMVGESMTAEHIAVDTFLDPASDRFALEADRDLGKDPLRYLIRPDQQERVKIAVAGLAPNLAEPLTAHYQGTLEFVPDVVLELSLTLDQRPGESFDSCGRCFSDLEGPFQVTSELDADCDGARGGDDFDAESCLETERFEPADCDDLDPRRHPRKLELCDGVDNDCDESETGTAVACFSEEGEGCAVGRASCVADAGFSECGFEGATTALPLELCAALSECRGSSDPVACFAERVGVETILEERSCEIEVAAGEEPSLCSTGAIASFEPGCLEIVVAGIEGPPSAARSLTLTPDASPVAAGQTSACSVEAEHAVVLGGERTLDRAARLLFFELLEGGGVRAQLVHLQPRFVETCGEDKLPECL